MATRESIKRYHLIINLLKRRPSTLKQVKDFLSDESQIRGYDFNISDRTFKRDCENIATIYGIDIVYDKAARIYRVDEDVPQEVDTRIMEAFDYIDAFGVSQNISEYVLFEKRRPQGTENIYGLLHAIKNQLQIKFNYQKYDDIESILRNSEPYALKEFRYRWYILAKDMKDNTIKTFALDRLSALEITKQGFVKPSNFSPNNYFKHSFGVVAKTEEKPEEVILSFDAFQGKYIKSLPFHHSQQILIDNDKELRIKLTLNITYDFVFEILSRGQHVKVIEPQSLIDELKEHYKNALTQYNK